MNLTSLTWIATFTLFAWAIPAHAIDYKTPIRNLDGTTVPQSGPGSPDVTLGFVIESSMIANNLPGDNPTGEEKAKRFWLAQKVHAGKEPLTAEEIALVKKVVGLAYGPLVIGRVIELVDPAAVGK